MQGVTAFEKHDYEIMGNGPQVMIIVHGFLDSRIHWRHIARAFTQTHTIYLFDLASHGFAQWLDVFSIEAATEHLLSRITALNIKMPVCLVGHSFGGRVSILLSFRYPHVVQQVIVMDISAKGRALTHRTVKNLRFLIELMQKTPMNVHNKGVIMHYLRDKLQNRWIAWLAGMHAYKTAVNLYEWQCDVHTFIRDGDLLFDDLIGYYDGDITVIYSEKSSYVGSLELEYMKTICTSMRTHIIADCGHWPNKDQPHVLIEHIKNSII